MPPKEDILNIPATKLGNCKMNAFLSNICGRARKALFTDEVEFLLKI